MTDEGLLELLSRGRAAARAGDAAEARFFLQWVLDRCDGSCEERLESLYWLSRISADPMEKRSLLEEILAAEPYNLRARNDLAVLDGRLDPAERVDPDRFPAPAPGQVRNLEEDEARSFTCPRCGGKLTYTPDGQSLACEYCDARELLGSRPGIRGPSAHAGEEDFQLSMSTARGHISPVDTLAASCQGCGGDFLLPPGDFSACCPYCGTSYVVAQTGKRSLIPPSCMIPFSISEHNALKCLQDWLASRRIQPEHTLLPPQGVYLPAWAFDLGGMVQWHGYRDERKGRIAVSGTEPVSVSNLLVPASPRLSVQFTALLPTYNVEQRVSFDQRYLVNWPAGTYQISVGDASLDARAAALRQLRLELPRIQCQGVEELQIASAGMVVESYQLWLLPVWIGRYTDDEKAYEVLINGQGGAARGETGGRRLRDWVSGLFKPGDD